jgi:hypothetical protein
MRKGFRPEKESCGIEKKGQIFGGLPLFLIAGKKSIAQESGPG